MEAFKFFMIFALISIGLYGLRWVGCDVSWFLIITPIIVYLLVVVISIVYMLLYPEGTWLS